MLPKRLGAARLSAARFSVLWFCSVAEGADWETKDGRYRVHDLQRPMLGMQINVSHRSSEPLSESAIPSAFAQHLPPLLLWRVSIQGFNGM
jgi:hypothetical protein